MFCPSVVHTGETALGVSGRSLLSLVGFPEYSVLSHSKAVQRLASEHCERSNMMALTCVMLSSYKLHWKQMSLLCAVISGFLLPISFPGRALV